MFLFATEGSWDVKSLLLAAIAVGAGAVGLALYERVRVWRKRHVQTPETLFNDLCDAHELSRAERELLAGAAAALPAGTECRVFFDPQCLERHAPFDGPKGDLARGLAKKLFE